LFFLRPQEDAGQGAIALLLKDERETQQVGAL